MQWQEDCVVLGVKAFSENARILTVFNETAGKLSGLVKSVRAPIQPGDISHVVWKGRLPEQLGTFQVENIFSPFPYVFKDPLGVAVIDSSCTLCANGLPERAPHPRLYGILKNLFLSIAGHHWLANYALFELAFLSEVGSGLDFSKCAVTGSKQDLYFVSPKTGCAVTKEVGEKYKDRLFVLPKFFVDESAVPTLSDIFSALRITEHFLKIFFYGINNKELPLSRSYLIAELSSKVGE